MQISNYLRKNKNFCKVFLRKMTTENQWIRKYFGIRMLIMFNMTCITRYITKSLLYFLFHPII